ncbi:hypothetical protein PRIPAC_87632 [Pristionchus pacificus]|uniref:HEAT domain-containing protein n=1 Tax=Pristionchus pacificus TaxID=54126 RepID=A0A2A6CYG3_PRIPA|nr:hypothetical protein PRIPAC_87632 [Pristionchus pacificus]|eukprot:PDM83264.1 HEAT domain-containing protein [Pristionchus pacificus]
MPLHREDRSVLRERARKRDFESDCELREANHVDMMKTIAAHVNDDGELIPSGERDIIDYIPDGSNALDGIYRIFKKPSNSDLKREVAIEVIDRMIVRNGEKFIRELAKANKLKTFSADLIRDVRNESNEGVKHFLCRAIGHLAEKRDSWPELHRFINMNVTSNDVSIRKTILELIGTWNSQVVEWSILKDLIVESILGSDSTLYKPAIKALGTYIKKDSSEDHEMMDILSKVTPRLLEQAEKECTTPQCEAIHAIALQCLCQIANDIPRVVRHQVEKIVPICTKKILDSIVCKKIDDRHCALQIITATSKHFAPSLAVDQIYDIVKSSIQSIANNMEGTDEWLTYDAAIDDSKKGRDWAITIGKWYLKEIATAIGKKRISPNLVTVTKEFLKDEKWEKRATALIGWAAVGNNFRDGRVISIVDFALSVVCDTHPRVRHYAIFLLGLLFCSYDLNDHPDRFEKVLTSLISNLSDPSTRVFNVSVGALSRLLTIGECPKVLLASNYDAIVPLLMSKMEKWEEFEICQFMSTRAIEIISFFADAAGKDRFKVHFNQIKSSMVMMLRSIETFDDSLSIAVNRICGVLGTDSVALLRLFTMKIDLKRDGYLFLETLIRAVHTDNFDGSDEMINEEKKVAYFVKKYAMEEECGKKVELTEGERKTMMRLLDYV